MSKPREIDVARIKRDIALGFPAAGSDDGVISLRQLTPQYLYRSEKMVENLREAGEHE